MIFKYGSYAHADNEVTVGFTKRAAYTDRGAKHIERRTMLISGKLHGDDVDDLTTNIQAMEAAYVDGRNAILYQSDGSTETAHQLINSSALGGVRVVRPPSFSDPIQGEYTTWRTFQIELEADYLALTGLLAFEETVTRQGTGGPRYAYLECVEGEPEKQQVSEKTVSMLVQTGRAVGVTTYPEPPGPLFAGDEDGVERTVSLRSPLNVLGFSTDWGIEWTYRFRRAGSGLNAVPNIR